MNESTKIKFMNKTFFVIGNGFDLYHGIKSKYSDFKQYLLNSYGNEVKQMDELFKAHILKRGINQNINQIEYWSSFEELTEVFNDLAANDVFKSKIQQSFSTVSGLQAQNYLQFAEIIRGMFGEWAKQIDISKINPKLLLEKNKNNNFYLTFNYTRVLEECYQIAGGKICHIHGSVSNPESIIVGFDKTNNQKYAIPPPNEQEEKFHITRVGDVDSRNADKRIAQIRSMYFKDCAGNIEYCKNTFNMIASFNQTVIIGLSCGEEDQKYISEILKRSRYIIYIYYNNSDKQRFEKISYEYKAKCEVMSYTQLPSFLNKQSSQLN